MIDWSPLEEQREEVPTEAIAQPARVPKIEIPEPPKPPPGPVPDPDILRGVDFFLNSIPADALSKLTEPQPHVKVGLQRLEKGLVEPEKTRPRPLIKTIESQKVHLWPAPIPPEKIAEPGRETSSEALAKEIESLSLVPSHEPTIAKKPETGFSLSKWFEQKALQNMREQLPLEVRELSRPDITKGKAHDLVFSTFEKLEKTLPGTLKLPENQELAAQWLRTVPEDLLSVHDKKLLLVRMADEDLYKDIVELQNAPAEMSFTRLALKGFGVPFAKTAWPSLSMLLSKRGREAFSELNTLEQGVVLASSILDIGSTLFWGRLFVPPAVAAGPLAAVGIPAALGATAGAQYGTGWLVEKGLQALGILPKKEEVEKAIVAGEKPPEVPELFKMVGTGLALGGGAALTIGGLKAILPQFVKDWASVIARSPAIRQIREFNNAVVTPEGKQVTWGLTRLQAEIDSKTAEWLQPINEPVKALSKQQRKLVPEFMDLVGQKKEAEALEILQKMKPAEQLKFAEAVEAIRNINRQVAQEVEAAGVLVKTAKGEIKPFRVDELPEAFREGWYAPRIVNPRLWGPLKKDLAAFAGELRDVLEQSGRPPEAIEKNTQLTLKAYRNFLSKYRMHKTTRGALEYIVKETQLPPGEALWRLAHSLVETGDELFFSPNLQRPRLIPIRIPGLHLDDIYEIYEKYLKNSATVVRAAERFGPRGEILKDLIDRIKDPVERQLTIRGAWYFARGHLADERLPDWYEKIWSWYIPLQVATKIGLGTANIANWFQPIISVFMTAGFTRAAKGLYKLVTDAQYRDFVRSTGATLAYDLMRLLSGVGKGGKMEGIAEALTKWNGFTGANRLWQTISAAIGGIYLEDLGRMAVGKDPLHFIPKLGVKRQQFALDYLRKLGVDHRKIGKDGSLPVDELKVGMYNFATRMQLQKAVAYEPLLINNPWVRPFTLFKRFGLKQWQMFYNDVLKYALINPMPLIRLALTVPLAGQAAMAAKELYASLIAWMLGGEEPGERLEEFWKKEKNKTSLQKLVEAVATIGALGMFSDWFAPRKVVGEPEGTTRPETIIGGMLSTPLPIQVQTATRIQQLTTELARQPVSAWPKKLVKFVATEVPVVKRAMRQLEE